MNLTNSYLALSDIKPHLERGGLAPGSDYYRTIFNNLLVYASALGAIETPLCDIKRLIRSLTH